MDVLGSSERFYSCRFDVIFNVNLEGEKNKFQGIYLIGMIDILQGKDVFIVDLYVPPTWLPPINQSPLSSFPVRNSFR